MSSTSFRGFGKLPPAPTTQMAMVGRVNHTIAQMLAMVVNELRNNWDEQLSHVKCAYNNSVSTATDLAPNEIHMGSLPRHPLMIFERTGVAGHQILARDHLAYCRPPTARIRYRPETLCPHSFSRGTPKLNALRRTAPGSQFFRSRLSVSVQYGCHRPPSREDGRGCQGPKLSSSLNWTGPYKVLAVGPCSSA